VCDEVSLLKRIDRVQGSHRSQVTRVAGKGISLVGLQTEGYLGWLGLQGSLGTCLQGSGLGISITWALGWSR